jgi:cobalt-zinc-cadmium resistance protein CzcA
MKSFIHLILQNRLAILLIVFLLSLWSILDLHKLNIDAVPDITNVQVVVSTKTGSLSPDQIERIVTFPIEVELSGVPGLTEMRSISKYGLSQIVMVFSEGTDLYFVRQLVANRIQTIDLPYGLAPELAPVTTGLGEIFMWTLQVKKGSNKAQESKEQQLQYLKWVQEYVIRPQMKRVKGVAEVDTNGGFSSEVHINYIPNKLELYGLNLKDLVGAVKSVGLVYSGSYIKKEGKQITVTTNSTVEDLKSLKQYIVKTMPTGKSVRLEDVADIRFDSRLRVGAATYNGQETVLGTVLMRIGENSRKVSQESKKMLQSIPLPQDVELNIVYNREKLVNRTIKTVSFNLVEGAVLVIIVLFFLLGNVRASLIVATAIPLSMLFALKWMNVLDISANLMSLGAIDFGLLVDASVVMIENYLSNLEEQNETVLSLQDRLKLVISSCSEVASPIINGLIIIMIVYIPILSLEGVEGKMFDPMAKTVVLALFGSLLVGLILMPIFILFFIKKAQHKEPVIFKGIKTSYNYVLEKALNFKLLSVFLSVLFFFVSLFMTVHMGMDFMPQLDEGDLVIGLVRDSSQNIDESALYQAKAEEIILQTPEVDYVFSRIGTPESATDPMSPNFADTFIILKKDKEDWRKIKGKKITKNDIFLEIKERLEQKLPEQDISMTQPIEMRFNEILEGSRADVTVRIFGNDLEELLSLAEQAKKTVSDIDGVQSIEFDALTGLTKSETLKISIDPQVSSFYQKNTEDIMQEVELSLAGTEVGSIFNNGVKYPIMLHLDEKYRNDLEYIKKIPISLENGASAALEKFSTLDKSKEVTTIARMWAKRYSAISIYLSGRDVSSFVQEARLKLGKNMTLPDGYSFDWGGQFKNIEKAIRKLTIIIPITLLIVFLLILNTTRSLIQSFIIFTSIPLGLAGGILTLYLRDMNLSIPAIIGFIALSGIVVLNSLVLVSFINNLYLKSNDAVNSVIEGAKSRLRPVSMTALVACLGFIPMAFNTGAGAEVQRPLATVVIGGLMSSTLLTMVIIPILMILLKKYVFRIQSL